MELNGPKAQALDPSLESAGSFPRVFPWQLSLGFLLRSLPAYCVMAKAKVTFRPIRKSDDNWVIIADYPGAEPREIPGFKSKTDIDE